MKASPWLLDWRSAKAGFFDRQAVLRALDRGARKVLSRFGAFVRQRARTSIRKRRGTSPPGQPPYSHTHLLRRHIYFTFDPARRSVVVGPVRLPRSDGRALRALEFGGYSTGLRWRRGRLVSVRIYVRARPFMRPALERELPALPARFRQVLHS